MKKIANIFKAFGDPVRLEILHLLLGKELCVCDILDAFEVSQPTISHHLKVLKQAGLVTDKRDGKWIYYSLDSETFRLVNDFLNNMTDKSVTKQRFRTCTNNEKCIGGSGGNE